MSIKVCLTGSSGFLGSWCLKLCLERGWSVNATTTSIARHGDRLNGLVPEATQAGRLNLFEANLLDPTSFTAAMAGCNALMHTASPFYAADTEEELVGPAVKGTEAVLAAAHQAGIKQVVLTSSTAAVYASYGSKDEKYVWSETDRSDVTTLREHKNWYALSKTAAENRAHELVQEYDMKLAVMNPCLIFGPMLQPNLNTSSRTVLGFLDGTKETVPHGTKCIVDVRDVAEAHCLALERPEAFGHRFLLVAACPHWQEIAEACATACPSCVVPSVVDVTPCSTGGFGAPGPYETLCNCSPAESILGITFRTTREMVSDTANCMTLQKHLPYVDEDAKAPTASA